MEGTAKANYQDSQSIGVKKMVVEGGLGVRTVGRLSQVSGVGSLVVYSQLSH